jgi:predicted RNA binding protein YcfA (HicA-like mRNA interferase family)
VTDNFRSKLSHNAYENPVLSIVVVVPVYEIERP